MKEKTENKGSALDAESTYNAQNAQFGLIINFENMKESDDPKDCPGKLGQPFTQTNLKKLLKS